METNRYAKAGSMFRAERKQRGVRLAKNEQQQLLRNRTAGYDLKVLVAKLAKRCFPAVKRAFPAAAATFLGYSHSKMLPDSESDSVILRFQLFTAISLMNDDVLRLRKDSNLIQSVAENAIDGEAGPGAELVDLTLAAGGGRNGGKIGTLVLAVSYEIPPYNPNAEEILK